MPALVRILPLKPGTSFPFPQRNTITMSFLPGSNKVAHLFIDASNVNVQLHEIPALDTIARAGFSRFATTFVAGSSNGRSEKPAKWSALDYQVRWTQRNGRPESEFHVDSVIVSAMQQDVLTHRDDASNRVLVLLSGDGNDNGGLPSFRDAVQQALRFGFAVKLVCYKPNPVYVALQRVFPGQMQIQILDGQQIAEAARGCATVPSAAAARQRNILRPRTASPPAPRPCRYFAAGNCPRGASCRFQHVAAATVSAATAASPAIPHSPAATPIIIPKSYRPPAPHPSHHQQLAESHGHSELKSSFTWLTGLLLMLMFVQFGPR
jgi:hypothetical protein